MNDEHDDLAGLFEHNRQWAAQMEQQQPGFFRRLSAQQQPRYMWIGCSDSRVPANQITGLDPGEVFVHRNVANVVVHSDLNALSALQFAVERLRVRHIMVVGHYGCAGVQAALEGARIGLADNWLRHIQDVRDQHQTMISQLDASQRLLAMCDLNVIEQVVNVAQTTVVADAWARAQPLTVHGWVYGLHDGLLQDLHISASSASELDACYHEAVRVVASRMAQPRVAAA